MRARRIGIVAITAFGLLGPASAAGDDSEFVRMARSSGLLEVELGKHAAVYAEDPAVKRFARAMVDDHDKANQELDLLVRRAGIPLQGGMSAAHREEATNLMNLHGADFDEAYTRAMVECHEAAVEAFSRQADPQRSEIDRWAANTLPVLRQHLAHARELMEGQRVSSNR